MQYENLPVFIPFFAAAYLFVIYGVLKIAELQSRPKHLASGKIEKASN